MVSCSWPKFLDLWQVCCKELGRSHTLPPAVNGASCLFCLPTVDRRCSHSVAAMEKILTPTRLLSPLISSESQTSDSMEQARTRPLSHLTPPSVPREIAQEVPFLPHSIHTLGTLPLNPMTGWKSSGLAQFTMTRVPEPQSAGLRFLAVRAMP